MFDFYFTLVFEICHAISAQLYLASSRRSAACIHRSWRRSMQVRMMSLRLSARKQLGPCSARLSARKHWAAARSYRLRRLEPVKLGMIS